MDRIVIIGGGPAGLIAAETLAQTGIKVAVYERKPSLGRKFLMAGRGGLNITHSEPLPDFMNRYRAAQPYIESAIQNFSPDDLRHWCEGLGQETFTGSSGRVFPKAMKASPLLRAWIDRLQTLGVEFHLQRTWKGWEDSALVFEGPDGSQEKIYAAATLFALGGASWPNLGSDGAWTDYFLQKGIPVKPLRPANCGFTAEWSDIFKNKFSGTPLKAIGISCGEHNVTGEAMITAKGLEGGAIYALSSYIRDHIEQHGSARITLDLRPQQSREDLIKKFDIPRGRQSFSTYLQKTLNLSAVNTSLLREDGRDVTSLSPADLANLIKAVPVTLLAPFSIERAISTAGGVAFDALDENFMLKTAPGNFVAGEMLDWEAPTGGYLLQASFATGVAAANGVLRFLAHRTSST